MDEATIPTRTPVAATPPEAKPPREYPSVEGLVYICNCDLEPTSQMDRATRVGLTVGPPRATASIKFAELERLGIGGLYGPPIYRPAKPPLAEAAIVDPLPLLDGVTASTSLVESAPASEVIAHDETPGQALPELPPGLDNPVKDSVEVAERAEIPVASLPNNDSDRPPWDEPPVSLTPSATTEPDPSASVPEVVAEAMILVGTTMPEVSVESGGKKKAVRKKGGAKSKVAVPAVPSQEDDGVEADTVPPPRSRLSIDDIVFVMPGEPGFPTAPPEDYLPLTPVKKPTAAAKAAEKRAAESPFLLDLESSPPPVEPKE